MVLVQGKVAAAVPLYEQAVAAWPGQVVVQYALATALAQSGRLRDAQAATQAASEVDAATPGAPFARALANLSAQLERALAVRDAPAPDSIAASGKHSGAE